MILDARGTVGKKERKKPNFWGSCRQLSGKTMDTCGWLLAPIVCRYASVLDCWTWLHIKPNIRHAPTQPPDYCQKSSSLLQFIWETHVLIENLGWTCVIVFIRKPYHTFPPPSSLVPGGSTCWNKSKAAEQRTTSKSKAAEQRTTSKEHIWIRWSTA